MAWLHTCRTCSVTPSDVRHKTLGGLDGTADHKPHALQFLVHLHVIRAAAMHTQLGRHLVRERRCCLALLISETRVRGAASAFFYAGGACACPPVPGSGKLGVTWKGHHT